LNAEQKLLAFDAVIVEFWRRKNPSQWEGFRNGWGEIHYTETHRARVWTETVCDLALMSVFFDWPGNCTERT